MHPDLGSLYPVQELDLKEHRVEALDKLDLIHFLLIGYIQQLVNLALIGLAHQGLQHVSVQKVRVFAVVQRALMYFL